MRSKKDSSNTKNVAAKNSMPDITARQKINAKSDVISFRNCPVLLPPNPNADFIFEDAQKVDVRTCTTYYNHPGEAVQPRLNIKNLKFDFMFLRDLQKILDVLKKDMIISHTLPCDMRII